MIEAAKSAWFDRMFYHYNKHYLLRRHFHFVGMQGDLDSEQRSGGRLYVANHSSWWDGMMIYHAFRTCSRGDHYVMMDEKQMRNYRFFRKLGVFSIDKSRPKGVIVSLQYAQKLLEAGKCVWMFPQGDIQHLEYRPIQFKSGVGYLLERNPHTAVIPVTLYYSLFHHQKSEASLLVGTPVCDDWSGMGKHAATNYVERLFCEQLERHRGRCVEGSPLLADDFTPLLAGGGSTSEAFLSMKKKVRAWTSFFGS